MCSHEVKWDREGVGALCPQILERKSENDRRKPASCELDQMSEVKLTTGEPEAC